MRAAMLVFIAALSTGCGLHFGVDAALGGSRIGAHPGSEPETSLSGAVEAYRVLVERLCNEGTLTKEECETYGRLLPILESATGVAPTRRRP